MTTATDPEARYLGKASLKKVKEDPKLVALLQYCRAEPSLSAFLRGTTIDVYWQGFVVFHVTVSSGKIRVGSESDKLPSGIPPGLGPWDTAKIPEYIAWVKEQRAERAATKTPELSFEASFIRDNQGAGSPIIVLDRQIARAGGKDQLDLMLLDAASQRLALAELKVARNPDIGGPVLTQLGRYVDAFGHLQAEYGEVLRQMQELGLVANRHATIDAKGEPLPVVMLAGVAVKKLGAPRDSDRLNALHRAASQLPEESKLRETRLLVFPRHTDQSFTVPVSLEDLPTIESWCERNLSK